LRWSGELVGGIVGREVEEGYYLEGGSESNLRHERSALFDMKQGGRQSHLQPPSPPLATSSHSPLAVRDRSTVFKKDEVVGVRSCVEEREGALGDTQ
jgi:hypothetical protein